MTRRGRAMQPIGAPAAGCRRCMHVTGASVGGTARAVTIGTDGERQARRRARMSWAGLLLLALGSPLAHADLASESDFRIAPQSLATALTAFSELTHIQIVTAAADLRSLRSPGVMQRATAAAALQALLRGTALRFQVVGADTVVIVADASEPAPPPPPSPDASELIDDLLVIGHGYTRASNTLAPRDAPARLAGAPAQALLAELPGVSVQNSDPFGLYEFGNSLRIRGFSSEQVGTSLDGVPLESYDMRDGSPPERFVDSEELSTVTVAQGSGDVMMPSYHALGGSVRYFTAEPGGDWHAALSSVIGSNDLTRLYARLDTPPWWAGGPIAYASASRTRAVQFDNSRAEMAVDHATFKLRQDFALGSALLSYRYGQRDDHDMQDYDARGRVATSFDLLERPTGDAERDALYYGDWTNGRTDHLLSLRWESPLADGWKLEALPYFERKRGYGYAGVAPSAASAQYDEATSAGSGVPGRSDIAPYDGSGITERQESLQGDRRGLTLGLAYEAGRHTVQAGGWLERYRFAQDRPLYNVDADGRIEDGAAPIVVYYDRHYDTRVAQYYLKDSSRWFDARLQLDVGFKGLYVDREFHGIPNRDAFNLQQLARIARVDRDAFQPQLGLTYRLDEVFELFGNYAENFSTAPRNAIGSVTYDPRLRPETSHNIDLGLRGHGERFSAALSMYYIDYAHRILTLTVTNPYRISEEVYRNVGSIRTCGVEAASFWKPARGWRLGSTLSLNRSRFQSDYERYDAALQETMTVSVAGKALPDTPDLMASLGVQYRRGGLSASAEAKYTGRRYSTATNDEHVPGNTVVNAALGYEFAAARAQGAGLQLQLTVHNLFDEHYIGYISPSEFVDNDNHGSFRLGAPRSVYLSLAMDWR